MVRTRFSRQNEPSELEERVSEGNEDIYVSTNSWGDTNENEGTQAPSDTAGPSLSGRSRAKCNLLNKLKPCERIKVQVTKGGQAIGDYSGLFSGRLGITARMHIPMSTTDFRKVSSSVRADIIPDMKNVFDWGDDPDIEEGILQRAAKIHRDVRTRGRKIFEQFTSEAEARANPPLGWQHAEWEVAIDFWISEEFKNISQTNKANSRKAPGPTHTLGRKSLDQLKHTHAIRGGDESSETF